MRQVSATWPQGHGDCSARGQDQILAGTDTVSSRGAFPVTPPTPGWLQREHELSDALVFVSVTVFFLEGFSLVVLRFYSLFS